MQRRKIRLGGQKITRRVQTLFSKTLTGEEYVLLILSLIGLLFFFSFNIGINFGEQQFWLLAKSFLQGHLYLGPSSITADGSYYQGHAYWPQGVFPALLLVPGVWLLDNFFSQGIVQFVLNLLNFYLLYEIAFKLTKQRRTAWWLSFGYLCATVYLVVGFIPWSWWFAQVVATSALLLLIYEYLFQKRWVMMGICIAIAAMTRIDLLLALIFPLLGLFTGKQNRAKKVGNGLLLLAPVFFGLAISALYNLLRFGSVLEFGYSYHIPAIPSAIQILHEHGTWSLFYFPTNLYYLFLKGIDGVFVPGTSYLTFPFIKPDPWGMSIVLTSPLLLWCLRTKKREQVVKISAITALAILLFLLGYFGIGGREYGYRYALDFQPFLFLMLCYAFQSGMSRLAKTVIVVSFLWNLLFFSGIFTTVIQ